MTDRITEKQVESLSGSGQLYKENDDEFVADVKYSLVKSETVHPVLGEETDPLIDITGHVIGEGIATVYRENVTLHLADGRRLYGFIRTELSKNKWHFIGHGDFFIPDDNPVVT
jgi:hypothetical protein